MFYITTAMLVYSRTKIKVALQHWNGLQRTFLLSYYTSKSDQAENSLVLPSLLSSHYVK